MASKTKHYKNAKPQTMSSRKNNFGDKSIRRLIALRPEAIVTGIFVFALFIRLVYFYQVVSTPIFYGLAMDSEKYESFALEIIKGNFTHKNSIYLNPMYPFFLALIYFIFGHSNHTVIVMQGLLDALGCLIIYYIASRLFNKSVGIIASVTYACYGIAIFYTGILLAPSVIIFFTLLFIASLLMAEEKGKPFLFIIAGIFFGFTVLAGPNIVLFLLVLPLWFFVLRGSRPSINRSIRGMLLFMVSFFIIIAINTLRNYYIDKELYPVSVLGGINFYIGNNPEAKGYFMAPQGISGTPIEEIKTSILYAEKEAGIKLTPSQASRYWARKGLKFIKDNPRDALLLYLKKIALFWRKEEIPLNISYPLAKNLVPIFRQPLISFGIISPLAIVGIILSIRSRKNALLHLFIFSYMASIIIFFVSARYRLPVVPFLIICASYTLYHLVEVMRARKTKELITVGILFFVLCAGVNMPSEFFQLASAPEHYNNLGKLYYARGDFDKAIANLRKALAMSPSFVEAFCNLGNVYFAKGMVKESIDQYEKALGINPQYAMAHYNLGLVYNKMNMLDAAVAEYKQAIAIDPNYAEAHTNLGFIYGQKGLIDEAITECEKAVAINPDLLEVHTNLGFFYRKKGMLDEAIASCRKALDIKPDYALAHYNLSVNYYYKGNYQLAILHCEKALAGGYAVDSKYLELLKPHR